MTDLSSDIALLRPLADAAIAERDTVNFGSPAHKAYLSACRNPDRIRRLVEAAKAGEMLARRLEQPNASKRFFKDALAAYDRATKGNQT
jgi:hypothetical protein